jgi:hypothetical protein
MPVAMDDHLWRLAWALPLVLAIGAAFILALKRWGINRLPGWLPATLSAQVSHAPRAASTSDALRVVTELAVSADTRVYLLEAGGQRWLLTESRVSASTQSLDPNRTP